MIAILVVVLIIIVNSFLLAVYCRFAEKQDARAEEKRIAQKRSENKSDTGEKASAKTGGIKNLLKGIYAGINPYVYGWMRYCIIITGKLPSHRIRNLIYRTVFNMKITKRTVIYSGCELRSPWNIHADRCIISTSCIIDGRRGVFIGEDVVFGGGVHLWTEEHDINDPEFRVNFDNAQPVKIGDHAWICSDSTILPGVHIGEGCVVATRAVVTKDCEDFAVYGGVPAKKIASRTRDLRYTLNGRPTWHFY